MRLCRSDFNPLLPIFSFISVPSFIYLSLGSWTENISLCGLSATFRFSSRSFELRTLIKAYTHGHFLNDLATTVVLDTLGSWCNSREDLVTKCIGQWQSHTGEMYVIASQSIRYVVEGEMKRCWGRSIRFSKHFLNGTLQAKTIWTCTKFSDVYSFPKNSNWVPERYRLAPEQRWVEAVQITFLQNEFSHLYN